MVAFNLKWGIPMALGAAALSTAAAPAKAQTPEKPISVRAGINYPLNGDVRDATNDIGFALGLSYDLPNRGGNGNGSPRIDLDWARNSGDGNKLDRIGVFAMYKTYFGSEQGGRKRMYAGIGVGVSRITARASTILPGNGNGGESDNGDGGESDNGGESDVLTRATPQQLPVTATERKTRFGAKAILGYDINDRTFIEASYTLNGKVSGARTDGLALQAGIRF